MASLGVWRGNELTGEGRLCIQGKPGEWKIALEDLILGCWRYGWPPRSERVPAEVFMRPGGE